MAKKNILIAFLLNLSFSVFEIIGGLLCGSIAIISDSVHDIGDALSIGISYFLERHSNKAPDKKYTYGYRRYSLLGSMITLLILIVGSIAVIVGGINRIINPKDINYDYMLIFAIVGVFINLLATLFTSHGHSHNQRAVNLHMLEDCLGWIVVLIGAVIMKFTDIKVIDPIMSICVSFVILVSSIKAMCDVLCVILLKVPGKIDVDEIKEHLMGIDGVIDIHHIHIWSIDGEAHYATMHVVADGEIPYIKAAVKNELSEHGIYHTTLEIEKKDETCNQRECEIKHTECAEHSHSHSHHHGF